MNIVPCHTIPSVTESVLQLNQSQYNVQLTLPNISPLETRCTQWIQVLPLKDEECQIVWYSISEVLYKLQVMVTSNKWQH